MKGKFLSILALTTVASVFCSPSFAHHGNAAYDTDKRVTVKGTVTQFIWSNPHCLLQFDVTDDSGHVVHWIAETENPSSMSRNGWSEKILKPGDQVTVTVLPLKNGRPIGRIIEVISSDGQRLPGFHLPEAGNDNPVPYSKQ